MADDRLRTALDSIVRCSPDARILQLPPTRARPDGRGPPASTVDAWFSSPPRPSEVVEFVERFFTGRRVR